MMEVVRLHLNQFLDYLSLDFCFQVKEWILILNF